MVPPPKMKKLIAQQNKHGVYNTKILHSPLSSSATLLCQINSTPGSFLKGISSLRRELYPPVRRNPPETRFPFEFPVSVCTPFVRESDGDVKGVGWWLARKSNFRRRAITNFHFVGQKTSAGNILIALNALISF